MNFLSLLLMLAGCWGANAYIVEGTVIEVSGPRAVLVDHEEIEGFMDAMMMDFDVRDPAIVAGLEPGDRIVARLELSNDGAHLTKIRVTGRGPVPVPAPPSRRPLSVGDPLPAVDVVLHDGTVSRVGRGQESPTALTFLYTTCPMPEFCPAVVARLQALQGQLPEAARIVAVTLDPEGDTLDVLQRFAGSAGASERWFFARAEGDGLSELAQYAALRVNRDGSAIEHSIRLLVLDAEGALIERYDDNAWPLERVVSQLATGGPPPRRSGSATPD